LSGIVKKVEGNFAILSFRRDLGMQLVPIVEPTGSRADLT